MKSFIVVVVNCRYCWEIFRFASDSFFFLFHSFGIFFYFFVKAARELRTEGKRLGYLSIQVLFLGFTSILRCECFPEPIEIIGLL